MLAAYTYTYLCLQPHGITVIPWAHGKTVIPWAHGKTVIPWAYRITLLRRAVAINRY